MQIGRIDNATRVIGKSQGYLGLPIRDELINCAVNGIGTPSMVTAWIPTPDELAALNAGAAVHVRLLGVRHPPIMLTVGDPPDESEQKDKQMSNNGWIGVDLDGTLAHYDNWRGPDHVGAPIPAMVERVKRWLAEGREIRIFTARVYHDGTEQRRNEASAARAAIEKWLVEHIGQLLPITNIKDYAMIELWDDRAVQVRPNEGEPVGQSTRGLE